MTREEYVCGICRHRFGRAVDAPRDPRTIMCPACGSIDVTIVTAERPVARVLRATTPAAAHGRRYGTHGAG